MRTSSARHHSGLGSGLGRYCHVHGYVVTSLCCTACVCCVYVGVRSVVPRQSSYVARYNVTVCDVVSHTRCARHWFGRIDVYTHVWRVGGPGVLV